MAATTTTPPKVVEQKDQAYRLSPGVYRINGRTIAARDSQAALRQAQVGQYAPQQQQQNTGQQTGGGSTVAHQGWEPGMQHAPDNLRGNERSMFYANQKKNGGGNATPVGPTNPDGSTTVPPATTAEVAASGNQVANASYNAATSSLEDPNNQVGQAFNPNLTARVSDGDLMANRQKVEDAVYARMTQNNAKNKAFDSNSLEQTLYNRGIPFDPQDAQRQRWGQALDQRYDGLDQAARQQAIAQADAANQTAISTNEAMRQNDYNIQQGTNQTQMGNFNSLANTGAGVSSAVVGNAGTNAGIDAIKKKTPYEIQLMQAQTGAAGRQNTGHTGGTASANQPAFTG